MTITTKFTVVVPAAGIGKRMGADCPKQYLLIAGKSILEHTLNNLLAHPQIGRVIVVLHPDDKQFKQLAIAADKRISVVTGGEERSDSVLAGLNAVDASEPWVLIHDAARPCLHAEDLTKLLKLAEQGEVGGILAAPVRDTMKRANADQLIIKTESRDNLWHALTPQFFPLALLKFALQTAQIQKIAITDEASAIEQYGGQVKIVEGRASNIKVTQPEDLFLATSYLSPLAAIEDKGE
ncbi:2-C-methyl-D-erythritol 4-phosphate cytidylyltransferase [Paraglaciecola hydrolytica]|uniref:2-C-methyl-D-erythritol 4-phosphate cytidylyltransferase n=1 Tax=Paraglaciecola hydrolytica TaxID=1799789 RepID=A0A136A5L9_9ALTE|nr:2-C-methyl-D-erythritol 4-phosphate cytidylyltransferase [Paraglaciecola hydrolytica]KXI30496.1 2-C-methyl-D-erythritol 4-phosphate cytidylyltransferase [Paraglaciecola hydrolytica]